MKHIWGRKPQFTEENMIDYSKIASAVDWYRQKGYRYIEVPWLVDIDTMLITRPPGARLFSTFAGELVASGEQSFLNIRHQLKPGKYQCVTPCFRDEEVYDKYHQQYFIKNELILVPGYGDFGPTSNLLEEMIDDALAFFKGYADSSSYPYVIDTPLGNSIVNKDIKISGIEVGSYGIRNVPGFTWIYGTGCAEPRFTQALKAKND